MQSVCKPVSHSIGEMVSQLPFSQLISQSVNQSYSQSNTQSILSPSVLKMSEQFLVVSQIGPAVSPLLSRPAIISSTCLNQLHVCVCLFWSVFIQVRSCFFILFFFSSLFTPVSLPCHCLFFFFLLYTVILRLFALPSCRPLSVYHSVCLSISYSSLLSCFPVRHVSFPPVLQLCVCA